jgi:hypothetical protein
MEQRVELIQRVVREMDTGKLYEEARNRGIVENREAFEKLLVMYFAVAVVA